MRLRSIVLVVVAFVAGSMAAQAAPFPGWERQTENGALGLMSPEDRGRHRVALIVPPPEAVTGDVNVWFDQGMDAFQGGVVKAMTKRSGIKRAQDLLVQTSHVERDDGTGIDLLLAAYPVGAKRYQLIAMIYPSVITDSDARVVYALDFIAAAYRARFAMTNAARFDETAPAVRSVTTVSREKTPPPPGAAPVPAPQQPAGQGRCRKPVWGLRVSPWCQPSGICNDLVIKGYEDC
ncbi:MAG: hypothetical protein JNK07_18430 [Alphaproteobacteria bacterium]|nr:hypothetical protein [Alphaproteobacteria bacterium]